MTFRAHLDFISLVNGLYIFKGFYNVILIKKIFITFIFFKIQSNFCAPYFFNLLVYHDSVTYALMIQLLRQSKKRKILG